MNKLQSGILLALVIIIALVLGPWLIIYSINTLAAGGGSDFHIEFNLGTWLATLWLTGVFSGIKHQK